ncbi:hypothetical protein [Alkalispirochaeta americana]|uniref:hypothetical protein n=1 Tax=Alkalispirochaeta americana TaxID=159291 RepID=UPI00135640D0|nr:hypothetical protein [Alkalispirochaeta americana]
MSVRTRDGIPVRIEANGHGLRGADHRSASCAAVSAVLKGLGVVLVENSSCTVQGSVAGPGAFVLTVKDCRDQAWLQGVADLLGQTLQEIALAWPEEVCFSADELSKTEFSRIEENSDGT